MTTAFVSVLTQNPSSHSYPSLLQARIDRVACLTNSLITQAKPVRETDGNGRRCGVCTYNSGAAQQLGGPRL